MATTTTNKKKNELQARIQSILDGLNNGLFERNEIMNLTFLSAIAEHPYRNILINIHKINKTVL
jgi:hypothetical protein